MTKTMVVRGLLFGAAAVALSGCYGAYNEQPAPTAYGYGYDSDYPVYHEYYYSPPAPTGVYYYGDRDDHDRGDWGPRGGKGL